MRREIFEIIANQSETQKGHKSFLVSILEEVKLELKEDAEKVVLASCAQTYESLIQTGYFKCQQDYKPVRQEKRRAVEEDIIQQRERLTVMGAILHPLDSRNFLATIAIVDQ